MWPVTKERNWPLYFDIETAYRALPCSWPTTDRNHKAPLPIILQKYELGYISRYTNLTMLQKRTSNTMRKRTAVHDCILTTNVHSVNFDTWTINVMKIIILQFELSNRFAKRQLLVVEIYYWISRQKSDQKIIRFRTFQSSQVQGTWYWFETNECKQHCQGSANTVPLSCIPIKGVHIAMQVLWWVFLSGPVYCKVFIV